VGLIGSTSTALPGAGASPDPHIPANSIPPTFSGFTRAPDATRAAAAAVYIPRNRARTIDPPQVLGVLPRAHRSRVTPGARPPQLQHRLIPRRLRCLRTRLRHPEPAFTLFQGSNDSRHYSNWETHTVII